MAHVLSRVPTHEPVFFLTIDDGWFTSPSILRYLTHSRLPLTAFLIADAVDIERAWFRKLAAAGVDIASHSVGHAALQRRSRVFQRHEVCGSKRVLTRLLAVRPKLFRPPYGGYDRLTRRLTARCYSPTLVSWSVVMDGSKPFFRSGGGLRRGDIVLMHFGPQLLTELRTVLRMGRQHDLRPARLLDYLDARFAPARSQGGRHE